MVTTPSTISTTNIFEELGAMPQEELPPQVTFGTPKKEGAPPDLRLSSHPMTLPYHDQRTKDPKIREWMEERRLGVGASEIAILFGLSPWSNLQQLWHEKVYGCSYEEGNELFHFGHEMEPLIATEFARRTGETVAMPPQEIIIGAKPQYRASLDRVVLEDDEPVAALELKNLNEGRYSEYRVAGPSIGYLLQLQYQMMVANLEYGYLAVVFGGQKFAAWRVMASPSMQREIALRVDEFWGYVERKERPPESLGVRQLATDDNRLLRLTDPSWEQRLMDLEELRLKKAKIEKDEKILKQQLKECLGDFQSAEAGEMVASVSISTRKSLDTARLKEECPDIVARFTKENQVKTLRVRHRGETKK